LSVFQARSPSRTVAARVIGNGTGANSKVVFVDRGSTSGVESGMAVVTPDGIVGKVVEAYPTASLVMLVTDPTFAAGVVSQKNRVHGTLKGQGHAECLVDYVQNEEHVDIGEWFYTSGDDRIFPKGFPVGQVTAAPNGKTFKEIYISPSGMQGGTEEVLIVLQAVHQEVPGAEVASPAYSILSAPTEAVPSPDRGTQPGSLATDADRLRAIYKDVGIEQKHTYGEGPPGTKPPDFSKIPNIHGVPPPNAAAPPAATRPTAPAQTAAASPAQSRTATSAAAQPSNSARPAAQPAAPDQIDEEVPANSPRQPAGQTADRPGASASKPATPPAARPRVPATAPGTNPAPATNRTPSGASPNNQAPGASPGPASTANQ
jgi:rod shape-determining protein MreC